ncbi:type II secretory pathway protein [Aliidiomarina minuta]|uniref:Type II secretion system protein K n=1 Tax=Aliidiomarina minuta TaxID=880057 RepID=A0A432W8N6_9GAMM|nr:type II secretion system minor pseudopilin GspK [Aliidiomarina minuta]RUO26429.1 type II secretory pathway protein [Aliidiomarina minuta]
MSICARQRGVALVMVLLVIALVAVIAVSMGGRLKGQIDRVMAVQQSEQAYWHWLSAEELVRQVLLAEQEEDETIHLNQNWATQQGPYPVEGGYIAGTVYDLQSCFNLNAMFRDPNDTATYELIDESYRALLEALEFDEYTSRRLAATLTDWLDEDNQLINQYGAEDADYESLPRPYQAANALLNHVSDLRQIQGYTREVYEVIRPYVCVIPGVAEWQPNINTIDAEQPELLSAVFGGRLDVQSAANVLAARPDDGFAATDEVIDQPEIQAIDPNSTNAPPGSDMLSVTSEYFELRAAIQYGEIEFFAVSKLQVREGEARTLHRSRRGYDWND